MLYASAYPNSAHSGGAMTAIAVVMVGVLAFWIAMVYVAAREPRRHQPHARDHAAVAAPDDLAEDEHNTTVLTG